MPGQNEEQSPRSARIELIGVALIALTAILSAWSAFESSKWGGEMSIRFAEAGAARTESTRASNESNREFTVDLALFTEYADATNADDPALAQFYADRFPDRLAIAVDAWLETKPLENPDAPPTPFAMDEYHLESIDRADALERKADERSELARQANQRSDNYTVTSIFFATVILFAALASKVRSSRLQVGMLVGAFGLFVVVLAVIATFPKLI